MIARLVVRCAVVVAVVLFFAFAAGEFPGLAVLLALFGGLAGLLYLVTRHREMAPDEPRRSVRRVTWFTIDRVRPPERASR